MAGLENDLKDAATKKSTTKGRSSPGRNRSKASTAPKRSRKKTTAKRAPAKRAPGGRRRADIPVSTQVDMPARVDAEQRERMIAEAAYYKAEQRGFQGGDPRRDWLEAEAEVDAVLIGAGVRRS
jgi:hypothetical protein